ncbi:hypothetical protein D9M72_552240 [compost metagenome]
MLVRFAEVADCNASIWESLNGENGAAIHPVVTDVLFHDMPCRHQVPGIGHPEACPNEACLATLQIDPKNWSDPGEEIQFLAGSGIWLEEHRPFWRTSAFERSGQSKVAAQVLRERTRDPKLRC